MSRVSSRTVVLVFRNPGQCEVSNLTQLNRRDSNSKANQDDARDSRRRDAESRRTAMSVRQEITRCREQEEPRCHAENERKVVRRHGGENNERSAQDGRKCVRS